IRPITRETSYQMANGEIDFAIGFLPELEQSFYQQQLFSQYYVVISRKDHPRICEKSLDIEAYIRESHVDVDTSIGHYHIENELINRGLKRNVLISIPSYLGVGLIVQET
ncbi:LysR substrate-binding domain-containing protein, partial [Acinetobacter variabilis]|uniref:LysR substrate-binding domain-containing protein n=2 Tax=Acinetobacter TaxID=469 RepID=UPI0030FB3488